MKYLMLARLQIKAAFKSLPRIFLGTAVFAALAVLICVCTTNLMKNGDNEHSKMDITVVLPDTTNDWENTYTSKAFDFLGEIDTVKSVCNFNQTYDKAKAMQQLKDGKVTAVIIIPEGFLSGILNGNNLPARIIFAKSGLNTESMMFREMITAGASDLSTAQAGVYAIDDASRQLLDEKYFYDIEEDINNEYFSYALNREVYFKMQNVSRTDDLSVIQFYVCTGVVLLMLLSGITCASLLKRENKTLITAMHRHGVKHGVYSAFKVLGVTVVYFCLMAFVYIMIGLASIRFPVISNVLHISAATLPGGLLQMFVFIFAVFAFVNFIFQLADNSVAGILLLFILTMTMMFAAGSFVPSVLLPKLVGAIGNVLPTAGYFKACAAMVSGTWSTLGLVINILYSALFIGLTALIERLEKR